MIEYLQAAIEQLEGEEGIQAIGEVRAVVEIDTERPETEKITEQEQHADNRPDVPIDYLFGHTGDLRVLRPRGGGLNVKEQCRLYQRRLIPNFLTAWCSELLGRISHQVYFIPPTI